MSKTSIEWATHVWNPLAAFDRASGKRGWFCTRVSDGCKNCYAAVINRRLGNGHDYQLRNLSKIEWRLVNLDEPLRARKPRRYFVNSMTDLFHEEVPDALIDETFAVMARAAQHEFLILTKRPERMAAFCNARLVGLPLPNAWLGTSVEDQQRADERIPHLLRTPAAVRFLSCEPLLGPLDLRGALGFDYIDAQVGRIDVPAINWAIVGGESGAGARPFNIAWAESIIQQCRAAGVPCFVKQLGRVPVMDETTWRAGPLTRILKAHNHKRAPEGTVPLFLNDSKGGEMEDWPEQLRVREFPQVLA